MIELTDNQINAMGDAGTEPARAVNPRTRETYVLLTLAEYQRLAAGYDVGGWTRDELHAQAWEAGKSLGWDGMGEYDDLPVKS